MHCTADRVHLTAPVGEGVHHLRAAAQQATLHALSHVEAICRVAASSSCAQDQSGQVGLAVARLLYMAVAVLAAGTWPVAVVDTLLSQEILCCRETQKQTCLLKFTTKQLLGVKLLLVEHGVITKCWLLDTICHLHSTSIIKAEAPGKRGTAWYAGRTWISSCFC